jgi:hypothetical protein
MFDTETYIEEPNAETTVLLIWGPEDGVLKAKSRLAQLEENVSEASQTTAKKSFWAKSHALDGRAEHRAELQNQQRLFKELLQKADIDYAVEAAFLWPKTVDIDQFKRDNEDTVQVMRNEYDCRIDFHSANSEISCDHIMMFAQSKDDAAKLMKRMINLIKETIAKRDQLITVNLVQIPPFDIYRDKVGFGDPDPKTESYLPTLYGKPAADETELEEHRRQTQSSNRKKIRKTLDSLIKKLKISQQHTRLRVVFGELGFDRFLKPAGGEDKYTFEEFYTMVVNGRTKLKHNSLPVRQGDITDLADILDEMEVFSERAEQYSAFFDFHGISQRSFLRLEAVFTPLALEYNTGEAEEVGETECREKRWLEIDETVSRLQISHLNFDRPDYQITLDSFPLAAGKMPKAQMLAFQSNVTMDCPPNGVKSMPHRRVKHPKERGLHFVSEIIMLKWRFKKTDGIFELRRKDKYDLRPGRESASPVETKWHALYYYPEWDNLLAGFAGARPGEDVDWVQSLATFIPENGDEYTPLPKGFKAFTAEVEELQESLAVAINRLNKGKGKAAEPID